jgi:hypothetical protein
VIDVKTGLEETLSVFPDQERLEPELMRDDGVAKNEAHSDDEAVRGTVYPEAVERVNV